MKVIKREYSEDDRRRRRGRGGACLRNIEIFCVMIFTKNCFLIEMTNMRRDPDPE